MNTVREGLRLFDDQFKMTSEVQEEYYQLIEDKVKQEEDEIWLDKLDENVCNLKHKVRNWLSKGKSLLKDNPSDLYLERNHTQVELHQNLASHYLATHQLRKEP